MLPLASTKPDDLRREVDILRNMHHCNIIRLLDSFPDAERTTHYLVMEHSAGGDLFDKIGTVEKENNEERARLMDPAHGTVAPAAYTVPDVGVALEVARFFFIQLINAVVRRVSRAHARSQTHS